MSTLRWSVLCLTLMAVICGGLLVFAVARVREAAMRTQCEGRFNQMQYVLHVYHDTHGHFPPAYVLGPDGKPWHSWRVLVLPYIEESRVYDRYRFDEPWNGPNNRLLADQIYLKLFQCASRTDYGIGHHTNMVTIVGDGTAFPGSESTKLSDFRDGGKHTIMLAEYGNSDIHWMEPRDLKAAEMSFQFNDPAAPSISAIHRLGPIVVFGDSIKGYRLRRPLSPETLKALTQTQGDPRIRRDALEHWDRGSGATLSE